MADKITEDDLPEGQVAHLNDMAATYQTWREAETRFREQLAAGRDMKPQVPFSLITEPLQPKTLARILLVRWAVMADKITEDDLPEGQVAHLNDMAATYQTWREAETRFREQLAAGRDMKPQVPFSLITEPLQPKTLARIQRGINKFRNMPPVVIKDGVFQGVITPAAGNTYEHPGCSRSRHLTDPLFTQSATLEHGIATQAFITEMRGGGSAKAGQHDPLTTQLHTVTAGGLHHGFCTFAKFNGGPADTAWHPPTDQLGTITARDSTGMVSFTMPVVHANSSDRYRSVLEQLATLTTARERYLVTERLDDGELDLNAIHFRMLKPHTELRRAMAFPDNFNVEGRSGQDVARGFGNAVTPPVAQWILQQVTKALQPTTP